MFHTYVLAFSHRMIDLDRASYLMDRELYAEARRALVRAMAKGRDPFDVECAKRMGMPLPEQWRTSEKAQFVWDYYCERHYETFGEPFTPNVDPGWDA